MHPQTLDLMQLFEGCPDVYGSYKLTGETEPSGKVKGRAATFRGKVTPDLWDAHLSGRSSGLGIVPIMPGNVVRFSAIDIDEYPLDLKELNKKIVTAKLPLVLCRTKSGGAHLYLFMRELTDAELVQHKLREIASFLGYGNCEIFPRQTKILPERGDHGNWINMPYFQAENSMRYALNELGSAMTVLEFVKYAQDRMVTLESLQGHALTHEEVLPDGPPCLQTLASQGFPKGTRNNGLFNLGIYAMKVNPDGYGKMLEEYNKRFMDPPLTSEEVLAIIKSLKKKVYNYTCKTSPIQQHCNVNRCRVCKHGVGGSWSGLPKLGTLTKLCTTPPIWFLEIEDGGRLELTTEQLQYFQYFQNRCMATMNIMPTMVKREIWQETVQKLLETVTVIEVPSEMTVQGQLHGMIEEFCTCRVQGRSQEELLLGKPWTNNRRHYFRLKDLLKYIDRQGWKEMKSGQISAYIKDVLKAQHTFINIKGRGFNVFSIQEFKQSTDPLDIPVQTNTQEF